MDHNYRVRTATQPRAIGHTSKTDSRHADRQAKTLRTLCAAMLIFASASMSCLAQRSKDQGEFSKYAGDAPRHVNPYAKDLSSAIRRRDVAAALTRVADWQLQRAAGHFDNDWTFAVLYAGLMAVPHDVAGDKYDLAMKQMGDSLRWQLGPDTMDANDLAAGTTYLDLYDLYKDPRMLNSVQARLATVMQQATDQGRPLWWWCDALFMAPATFARLSQITGDPRYLDFMDKQWIITSAALYDNDHKLFFRDARFFSRRESNGSPVFWARGNGWVLAGLARVLQSMPANYPSRPRYVTQFREMAGSLAALQQSNGLWTAGLLDSSDYPSDETSGTGLIAYGLAYGINSGLLSKDVYTPHVALAWHGLVSHVFVDGRLGSVQKVADSPGHLKPTSSYVYGVGAYLLAGSEIYKLAQQ